VIDVEIRSVSQLSDKSALVRFASVRRDQGGTELPPENWVAIIKYRCSNAPMTVEDRYVNPLGFEVTDYRKDAETLTVEAVAPAVQSVNPTAFSPMPSTSRQQAGAQLP
jgi:type IV secretion system protein VirB8